MAISQNQIVDYLNKKVGYGVAKTDLYTAKQPYNESIASPLLVPGATVLQQDYAIPNVSSAPSANTVVNGGTVVSVYNTSTSAVVQGTSLSESETNETWSTGLTNWIPPSFGSGYQLKIYAGPPGASAATAAQYTNLPVAGTGASDSWFFDYQSGVLNFADTIVPTAAANVSNVVYFMGAVYTGTLGITNYANLAVTGNLTSINGNIVLTNGNVYAQNYYGVFQGTIGSGVTAGQSNVAYYDQITNLSNNQTYYLEFANLVAGNSIIGAVSTVNVNPSTGTLSATAFSGTTGTLGGTLSVTGNISTQANLSVSGNVKISGNLEVDGTLTYLNTTTTQISGTEIVAGVIQANSGTASTNTTSGALQVLGGAGITGAVYAGSIQSTPIGSTTASTGAFTTLTASSATNNNQLNYSSGALQVTGGGGFGGNVFVGGNLFVGGNINLSQANISTFTGNSGQFFGNAAGFGALYAGVATGYSVQPQTVVQNSTNFNGYAQVNHQNINSGANASTDYVATMDTGGAAAGYIDMGINGSGYNGLTNGQSLSYAGDGYLYVQANTTGSSGNLLIGTGATTGNIFFATGGLNSINQVMTITTANTVVVTNNQSATSTTSGALQVAGGVGIQGALYAGSIQNTPIGSTTASSATFTSVTAQTESVGGLQAVAIGNVTPGLGFFTTANATNVYAATVGNVGTTLYGVGTNITGAIPTANVALYDQITNLTNNQVYYLEFANVVSGNSITGAVTSVNVNPSTGTLSASLFVGNAAGLTNIPLSALSGTYPTANVAIYEQLTNSTTNATFYVPFYDKATGNALAYTNTSLNFNPSNGTLVASTYYGAGTGLTGTASSLSVGYASSAGSAGTSGYATYAGQISMSGEPSGTTYLTTVNSNSGQQNLYAPGGATWVESTGTIGASAFQACNTVIVGSLNYTPSQALVQVGTNTNGFTQIVNQNQSNGNNASADIAAVANNGSDNDTYTDMGIVSSTYNQAAYSLYKPNDGYLIVAGNTTTGGGNLILNTYQKNDIIFATGGTFANAEVARFRGNTITNGNLTIKLTTPNSLSANTGAFQLWGGASISGNAYIGGSSYQMGGALFNHNQASAGTSGSANQNAFIMQGVNDSTLIYAKPLTAYDAVIIGGNAASASFAQGAKFIVNSTDSMILPVGTSAQRPGSSGGTDTTGMLRYSSTVGSIEWYNGTTWGSASTSFTVIADQQFTGTGSQTAFTLSSSQTTASCIVSINGVVQIPTLAYSVSGTTLTFTEAPLTTDVIDVRMLTTTSTVAQLYDTSGYNTVNTITGTGVTITTGTSALTTQYTFDTNGGFVTNGSNVTIASAGTSVIDNLFANSYSSAKYTITATIQGTTIREVTEVLMVHTGNGAGAGSVYMSSYGRVNTAGNTLVTYSGATSGNIAQLQATTTNANTILRIKRDYMAI